MANGNGKTIVRWVSIGVTILSIFILQIVNADVRNRKRDAVQDEKISLVQADIREIKTNQTWMKDKINEQMTVQKEGFTEIKQMIRDMK